jgi:hypothetical protein
VQQPQPQRKPKDKISPKINSRNSLKEEDVLSNPTQLQTKKQLIAQKTHTLPT